MYKFVLTNNFNDQISMYSPNFQKFSSNSIESNEAQ